ncbi:hypothetical protein [Motilimonas sp. E26]|uniref:hypothetical protein n=1 Tax=Motilimonas sp. E26 TaxID=2865674 RepID=UPI001E32F84D|nr:hypothetical protein [Motilimonas sp. E26]MCE0557391.1 hypothetical protein [Motilimonas sp. E26]
MNRLRFFNAIFFIALILFALSENLKNDIDFDGYFTRTETILSQGQNAIELTANADFLSNDQKYTSVVKIADVEKGMQYITFILDGDIYKKGNTLIARTNTIEEIEDVDRSVIFDASTSPVVTQIQKSFLGIDVYKERMYERILIEDFLCYYDLDKHLVRCMEQR